MSYGFDFVNRMFNVQYDIILRAERNFSTAIE